MLILTVRTERDGREEAACFALKTAAGDWGQAFFRISRKSEHCDNISPKENARRDEQFACPAGKVPQPD